MPCRTPLVAASRMSAPVLPAYSIHSFQDAAWQALNREGVEKSRERYESFEHLNNAYLVGRSIVTKRAISAGEQFLVTKGWSFYQCDPTLWPHAEGRGAT